MGKYPSHTPEAKRIRRAGARAFFEFAEVDHPELVGRIRDAYRELKKAEKVRWQSRKASPGEQAEAERAVVVTRAVRKAAVAALKEAATPEGAADSASTRPVGTQTKRRSRAQS